MNRIFSLCICLVTFFTSTNGSVIRNELKRTVNGFHYIVSPDSWAFEDGHLTSDELRELLREGNSLFQTWTDDQVQSVVDVIMSQNDVNGDGVLDAAAESWGVNLGESATGADLGAEGNSFQNVPYKSKEVLVTWSVGESYFINLRTGNDRGIIYVTIL